MRRSTWTLSQISSAVNSGRLSAAPTTPGSRLPSPTHRIVTVRDVARPCLNRGVDLRVVGIGIPIEAIMPFATKVNQFERQAYQVQG